MTKRISWLALALLPLAGLYLAGSAQTEDESRAKESESPSPLLRVEVVKAKQEDRHARKRWFRGQIEARRESDLSFELRGRLIKVSVQEGARIEKGAVLARLESDSEEARAAELRARLAGARARLAELVAGPRKEEIQRAAAKVAELRHSLADLRVKEKRVRSLVVEKVSSQAQEDEAGFARKAMEARLDAAQARLAELESGTRGEQLLAQRSVVAALEAELRQSQVRLTQHVLRAPYAGRISARFLDEGRIVNPGTAVLHLIEDSHLEGRVGFPARQAALLQRGQVLQGFVGEQPVRFLVQEVLPVLDAQTHTQDVLLHPQGSTKRAFPVGEVLRVEMVEPIEEKGFWLPGQALLRAERGLWAVFVARANRPDAAPQAQAFLVERRLVEVLYAEEARIFVRGTLETGELVVASGVHRLATGQRVRIEIEGERRTSGKDQ